MARHDDLDWVRTVSAVSVVLLHTSSNFANRYSRMTLLGVTPALLCNQVTRFAVPVFFLLSGLSLGLSKRPLKLPAFWMHRLRKIAVPYVLWSLFYFLLNWKGRLAGMKLMAGILLFGRLLLNGGAESHLWFLPVLFQLYLFYPGLKSLLKRAPGWTLAASFLLALLCTLTVYVPLPLRGWLKPRLWRLFPTWLFYFVLGVVLTEERLGTLRELLRKHTLPLCLSTAVLALIYAWDSLRCGNLDSIKPQLFLFAPLCFLALLAFWKVGVRCRPLALFSRFTARHAMTVYFVHIFFLRQLRRYEFLNRNAVTMLLTFAAVLILSIVIAFLPEVYDHFFRKTPVLSND